MNSSFQLAVDYGHMPKLRENVIFLLFFKKKSAKQKVFFKEYIFAFQKEKAMMQHTNDNG